MIFFDLDGTLVDHRSAVMETIAAIVRAAPDATAPPDELVALWWSLEARHMREYLAGQCSFAEHHRRRLRSFLPMLGEPVPDDPALLDAWIEERYLSAFEESWQTYPDVRPCLEALKELPRGPRLAVLTNGDPGQQRAKLARFGLLGYFEAVLTPTELGAAKPAAYAAACAWMRTEPARDRTTDRPRRPADPPPRPFAARPVGGDSVQLRQSETELAVELELVEVLTV
ncbi:putative hydrolase of the HAD superfamily [Nonomuraea wenchangensis]|uniref:Putative hydrolase of the HAD superfamily n=1 Tax=Nonomuraea wenchangensis TaxID=568860 RepID=A0A1H9YSJ2_9ACTN|nr:putative hydrolase of the HAD superfamily [Nonomuraea wenchangensis]